jgi:membrane-anchored protein YejM (alkaline phosphatase superfamily)
VVGSYYNSAILQPGQVTVQFPGGYYEVRDSLYRLIPKPTIDRQALFAAFSETGRFFRK